MTFEQAIDRIECVLKDFANDDYDDLPDADPMEDIAEIVDSYRNNEN